MMKNKQIGLATVVLSLIVLCSAQEGTPSANSAKTGKDGTNAPSVQQRNPRYELRPGDGFDLVFEFNPELNQSLTVQPDGFITLREIGDLHVAGMTVPEITARLRESYDKIVQNAAITVFLKDFDKPYFICNGQVAKPGKYELRADTTVTEALAIAGGFLESAKHSQVVVFRRASQGLYQAKLMDVKKMLASRNLEEDYHLQPGDMIWVPQNKISKIKKFLPIPVAVSYTHLTLPTICSV